MKFDAAIRVLKSHGMVYDIRGGRIYVADECCIVGRGVIKEWVCIEGWSYAQLMTWLGY